MLSLALALRLAAAVWWQSRQLPDRPFAFGDSYSYWELARAMAAGEPYRFHSDDARVFRTPGYPAVLSVLYLIWRGEPPVLAARALGAVFGTLAALGVYLLGRNLFDELTGLVAATLVAVYPGLVALSVFVLSEAPFCGLMALQLALWVIAWRGERRGSSIVWAVAAGLLGAAATLVRPSWLFFTPLAAVLGLLSTARPRSALIAVGVVAGFVIGMLPWWARNYLVIGRPVLTTLQVGASLYDGLNPQATGGSDMNFVPRFEQELRGEPVSADAAPFEYRLDERLRDAAIDWARAHPRRALELAAIKIKRLWNVWPNEPQFRSWPLRLIVAVTYLPLMALALVGAWRFRRRGFPIVLCALPAMYFTALHAIFVSSIRYREPAMLGLAVLAAAAICRGRESAIDSS